MMKSILFVFLCTLAGCTQTTKHDDIEEGWKKLPTILNQINTPKFPDLDFNIVDYGAKSDGSLCTESIKEAIKACHDAGGGRVIVPEGEFTTGAIHLLSNIELHVSQGAKLLFSTNPEDYLPVVHTRYEGVELFNYSPLIYAYKQKNIAITGTGILDGQASMDNWWFWAKGVKEKTKNLQFTPNSIPRLMGYMSNGIAVEERVFGPGSYLRPSFVQPYLCENILIENVTIVRPPMWMLHPVLSKNITVKGVKLYSPNAPNGDGCNPEASKNVLIENCEFNTGDDCIAIKSGRNKDGFDLGIPSENIVIRNCKMKDGHGGVVMGSETSGGVKNVYVYDCEMDSPNLERAIRLKSNKYRGGTIENIYVKNIEVGQVKNAAIRINQNYFSKAAPSEIRHTTYRNIFIENITCQKADYAIQILGLEEHPIENVKILNSKFTEMNKENVINSVNGLVLEDVEVNGKKVVNF